MRTPALACVGLLALLLPSPGAEEQVQQVPGAIRSRVVLVPVDVRVVDRDGRPVTDLQRSDFVVLENGVTQEIGHFATQAFEPVARADPLDGPRLRRGAGLDASPITRRTFLIVLGRGRLQDVTRGMDALKTFVTSKLLPQDLVAVQAYGRTTDLTTDRESIVRLLERYQHEHVRIEALLDQWFSGLFASYSGEPPGIEKRIEALFNAPGLPRMRRLASFDPAADEAFERVRRDAAAGTGRDLVYNPASRDDYERLHAAIEYLRYLEGEKHLLFVTEQGLLDVEARLMDRLAAAAADARIAISTIRTGGVTLNFTPQRVHQHDVYLPTGPPPAEFWANADLRAVAGRTGGLASAYRYASEALDRVDRAARFQYLIGYYPTKSDWNGDERQIEVRVNRPGLTVLHRGSYVAREDLVPFDRRTFLTHSRIMGASAYRVLLTDVPVTLAGQTVDGARAPWRVRATVTIDVSGVTFDASGGRHVASVDVALFAGGRNQRVSGESRQRLELKLEPVTYARALREGLKFETVVTAKQEPRYLKVVVYDYAADKLGSALIELK